MIVKDWRLPIDDKMFDILKSGDIIYTPSYTQSVGWVRQECRYAYHSTENKSKHWFEVPIYDSRIGYTTKTISGISNRDIFVTKEDCDFYIQEYFTNKHCNGCKYDNQPSNVKCSWCKHYVPKDKFGYCDLCFQKSGIPIAFSSEYVCKDYEPDSEHHFSTGWTTFEWYLEVLKNCWLNADDEADCPGKLTICRTGSYKQKMESSKSIYLYVTKNGIEFKVSFLINYLDFIHNGLCDENGKIFVCSIGKGIGKTKTKTTKYKEHIMNKKMSNQELQEVILGLLK